MINYLYFYFIKNMKVIRVTQIKKLHNKQYIIDYLSYLVKQDESLSVKYSLALESNLPNEDYYVILDLTTNEVIPAYMHCKNQEAIWLWIHPNYRNQGYGKYLVDKLNIKYALTLESSVPFWNKLGFKQVNCKRGSITMKKV